MFYLASAFIKHITNLHNDEFLALAGMITENSSPNQPPDYFPMSFSCFSTSVSLFSLCVFSFRHPSFDMLGICFDMLRIVSLLLAIVGSICLIDLGLFALTKSSNVF